MSIFREIVTFIKSLFTWLVVVSPWEQAVRVRLGKHVRVLGAGVHVRLPFVDNIFRQSTRRRISLIPTQTITTKDKKTITIGGAIGFEILDLLKLYQTLQDPEDTIIYEAMGHTAQFITSHDLDDCEPKDIQMEVAMKMNLATYGLGKEQFFLTDFAVVRTYRIMQGGGRDWKHGDELNTSRADGPGDD